MVESGATGAESSRVVTLPHYNVRAAGGETAATAPGTVKARVAAMQSRIQADEEARRREEAARRQQEKDDLAKWVLWAAGRFMHC